MKVKLLDVSLIRTFGGVVVDMTDTQAARYINKGLAVSFEKPKVVDGFNKKVNHPNEDKMVWSPPEEKLFSNTKVVPNGEYPGANDTLFSQIK
jgi:hypothetical protein